MYCLYNIILLANTLMYCLNNIILLANTLKCIAYIVLACGKLLFVLTAY